MFSFYDKLISFPNISNWDTSKLINMSSMFKNLIQFESLPDISQWNVSNVKDISGLFR